MELRKKFANETNNHSSHPVALDDSEISYGSIGLLFYPYLVMHFLSLF
jgi:hypothetical protein